MATAELVTEQFKFLGIDVEKDVLRKCVSLCEEHNVDAETFSELWMAFSLTHLNGASPTLENLDLLAKRQFSKLSASMSNAHSNETAQTSTGSSLAVYGVPVSTHSDNDVLSNYMSPTSKVQRLRNVHMHLMGISLVPQCLHSVTRSTLIDCIESMKQLNSQLMIILPKQLIRKFLSAKYVKKEIEQISQPKELRPATYSPTVDHSAKYASRTNQGSVVHSYGVDNMVQNIATFNSLIEMLELNISQVPNEDGEIYAKAKFGFELLQEKASTFDNHIQYISHCILKKNNIKESASVRHKSQTEVFVSGRIECDADARLNAKSVVLQGTWEESLSQAVPVDLDSLKQYSLFPGQVVVMRGLNTRGDKFLAQEVYYDASNEVPDHRANMLNILKGSLSMVVAAGPYTTSDNMAYEPLADLIAYINANKPHVVILTGPFMDSEHAKIKDNSMAETFDSFFNKLIDRLCDLASTSPTTKIYIVSNLKDAFHVNVYPTPAYSSRRKNQNQNKYNNIHFLPDPSTLNINGVIVGVTSSDILMDISKEEISLGMGGDKLARLASHVLAQQTYYPLWPPPAAHPVDAALWAAHAQLPCSPHVLILPSNFRYFVKEVNKCVVVNPEHLAKGTGGGTFARLLISGHDESLKIAAQVVRI